MLWHWLNIESEVRMPPTESPVPLPAAPRVFLFTPQSTMWPGPPAQLSGVDKITTWGAMAESFIKFEKVGNCIRLQLCLFFSHLQLNKANMKKWQGRTFNIYLSLKNHIVTYLVSWLGTLAVCWVFDWFLILLSKFKFMVSLFGYPSLFWY